MDADTSLDLGGDDESGRAMSLAPSASGPAELLPLPKPQSLLSAVEWSQREPEWYHEEVQKESERVAKNYLGKLYRNLQQEKLGVVLYQTVQPWPPYLPLPDKGPEPKHVPRRIYDKAPFVLKVGVDPPRKPIYVDPLKVPPELVRRKRDIQHHLNEFGKTVGGAPYNFNQTTSRIEAKSQYRKHKWQLSKSHSGPLGPMEAIGFDYPKGKAKAMTTPFSMSASMSASTFLGDHTQPSALKKSGSLPALAARSTH
eukprot:TRINITY_DN113933_c0_g1_i1.p1 TRINITY_DN113933_c0_g1~~TRINITY_DN113933_c0_g1_i1.p1  ORF type:complete len:255 (-),score=49.00 TRINITY_DN113933_c0_g1_i1:109-873(-)